MGNCFEGNRRTQPPDAHRQEFEGPGNQLYPSLSQHDSALVNLVSPSAPPPYSVHDPITKIPQVRNGRRSVRLVQRERPSLCVPQQNQSSNRIMVAAIDFGTTFCGYAFSFRHEYETDKLKISTNLWPHNSGLSAKAPSAVLIGPNQQVVAFGYEAQKKYADMVENEQDGDHLFFQKFKMVLYTAEMVQDELCELIGLSQVATDLCFCHSFTVLLPKLNCIPISNIGQRTYTRFHVPGHRHLGDLTSQTVIRDVKGREMAAIDVFGLVIGYLRNHLLQRLHNRDNKNVLQEDMIHWVLTVPAIWSDKAKQFMRRAAEKGGIKNENLTLALEPEAASIYCKYVPQCISGGGSSTAVMENGTKYLILDLGGGTVDVTVHEIQTDGSLQEVHHATGGCWGGTTVDDEFWFLMVRVFGIDVMTEANKKYPNEILDLFLDFEMKKRTFEPGQSTSVSIKCPACLYELYRARYDVSIQENIENSPSKNEVEFKRDKIFIFATTFNAMFKNSVALIVQHVNQLLHSGPVSGVSTILLVGGYADSYVIKDAIISNFPHLRIINPDDCSLAVLKGAVLFGHNPETITSRICKFTYGIVMNKNFVEGVHPECKRRSINGLDVCDDLFNIHLKKGEKVEIGKPRPEKVYYAPYAGAESALLEVYASTSEAPVFVTEESCSLLGSLVVNLQSVDTRKEQLINVSFHYCGTELEVTAREQHTGNVMKAKFDFLG